MTDDHTSPADAAADAVLASDLSRFTALRAARVHAILTAAPAGSVLANATKPTPLWGSWKQATASIGWAIAAIAAAVAFLPRTAAVIAAIVAVVPVMVVPARASNVRDLHGSLHLATHRALDSGCPPEVLAEVAKLVPDEPRRYRAACERLREQYTEPAPGAPLVGYAAVALAGAAVAVAAGG